MTGAPNGERLPSHLRITMAYLASLARFRQGRFATFDRGVAATHPDVADLVDVR